MKAIKIQGLLLIISGAIAAQTPTKWTAFPGIRCQEIVTSGDTIRIGTSSLGQLLRYNGTQWVNWTPDYAATLGIDTVYVSNDSLYVVQGTDTYRTDISKYQSIQFDTLTAETAGVGELVWNNTDGTIDLGMRGATQQVGQELFRKVINKTGIDIENGKAVYIIGRQGNRGKIAIASGASDATAGVIGLTTQDIANNEEGFVTTFGYVRNIKTNYSGVGVWGNTWALGDTLWVSDITPGELTNIEPDAPHHSDIVGTVAILGAVGIGAIDVCIRRHTTLSELSDINGTALTTTGQLPVWNQDSGFFDFDYNLNNYKLISDSTALSGYATNYGLSLKQNTLTNPVTSPSALISGYLTHATGSTTIDTSAVYWDSPNQQLNVSKLYGGSAVGSNIIYKSTTGTGTTTGIAHQFTGGTNGATTIAAMLNNGNIGIGTTTALHKLSILSNNATNLNALNLVDPDINKNRTTVAQACDTSSVCFSFTPLGKPVFNVKSITGNQVFGIDSTAKIGIGTSQPDYKLQINNGDISIHDTENLVRGIRLYRNNTFLGGFNTNNAVPSFYSNTGYGLDFTVNSTTTAIRVLSNANIGVGTTAPDKKLEVNQTTAGAAIRVAYNDANGSAADYFDIGIEADGDGTLSTASGDTIKISSNIKSTGTIQNVGNYANIYVADGVTAQSIATGATYTKLTGFTTDGQESTANADVANDKIVAVRAGKYMVNVAWSGSVATANSSWDFAVFVNGVEQNQVHFSRKFSNNDIGAGACSGIISASANQDIDLRVKHDQGGSENITPHDMSMSIYYIGE